MRSKESFVKKVREVSDGEGAAVVYEAIGDGILDANINAEYALKDAVRAHQAIESGKTLGATVLIP